MGPQQDFIWNKVSSKPEKEKELTRAFLQPFPHSSTITLGENDQFLYKDPFLQQTELSQGSEHRTEHLVFSSPLFKHSVHRGRLNQAKS